MAESEGGNLKLYSGFHRKSVQLKEKSDVVTSGMFKDKSCSMI